MHKKIYISILKVIFLAILIYTRVYHLDWGLPFPFHPDERNMAVALQQLSCPNFPVDCLNPHFFAYGQFPLYIGFILITFYHAINHLATSISFDEAVMALRTISAACSILTILVIGEIFSLIVSTWRMKSSLIWSTLLLLVFSPGLIQFAHFGTTESLLMLCYVSILYVCILYVQEKVPEKNAYLLLGIITGIAVGVKVSSLFFLALPIWIILSKSAKEKQPLVGLFFIIIQLVFITFFVSFLVSPQNLISFADFISSMRYESSVATGQAKVFYTKQFEDAIPFVFQLSRIFPFVLGPFSYVTVALGFLFLPRKKETKIIRLAIVFFLIFNVGLYTKWTRFMAPVLPLLLLVGMLFISYLIEKVRQVPKVFYIFIIFLCIVPGFAFLSIYQKPDIRQTATNWIEANIPENALILQESGNVVDLPLSSSTIRSKSLQLNSIDFYGLADNPTSQMILLQAVDQAQYIIVPSRRVFANYTCALPSALPKFFDGYTAQHCQKLGNQFHALSEYYKKLFNGSSGFKEVARFTSYPTLTLLGKTVYVQDDEKAEETWTVFDHPVVRIYKKIPSD